MPHSGDAAFMVTVSLEGVSWKMTLSSEELIMSRTEENDIWKRSRIWAGNKLRSDEREKVDMRAIQQRVEARDQNKRTTAQSTEQGNTKAADHRGQKNTRSEESEAWKNEASQPFSTFP